MRFIPYFLKNRYIYEIQSSQQVSIRVYERTEGRTYEVIAMCSPIGEHINTLKPSFNPLLASRMLKI